jgi:hypothetical protein
MRDPSDPFYIATRTIPLTGTEGEQWFVRQRFGEKKLASIMKTLKQKAGLDTNKHLANHSARKYLVQKLKEKNNGEGTDSMQISGHKSVQSMRNYSAISEEKHKRISNVLADADSDNSRALLPIQTTTPASTNISRAIAASTGADITYPNILLSVPKLTPRTGYPPCFTEPIFM